MRKLIKKILKEDEYDFIRDVVPELRKGMYLCNKHGRPFEIHGVGENWMTFYQDDVNRTTISHKINYIMSRLKSGTMTICNPLNESDEFDWIRNTEPKWDVSNIHLVAGKKFHLNPAKFTINKIYWFSDKIEPIPKKQNRLIPTPRDIKICWEEHSVKCGRLSSGKIIDLLNKNEWILLDDVIKESNESDEDPLKWIKDVKTNQDIAKELYDGLEWHKEENTYFVRNQWNGIPYSVRPYEKGRDKIIINPSSFHKNYRKYMIETLGIWRMDDAKEIYFSLRKLIAQKIHNK